MQIHLTLQNGLHNVFATTAFFYETIFLPILLALFFLQCKLLLSGWPQSIEKTVSYPKIAPFLHIRKEHKRTIAGLESDLAHCLLNLFKTKTKESELYKFPSWRKKREITRALLLKLLVEKKLHQVFKHIIHINWHSWTLRPRLTQGDYMSHFIFVLASFAKWC